MPTIEPNLALHLNNYSLALLVVGLFAGGLAFFLWRRRSVPGASGMMLAMLGVMVWSFGYAGELAGQDAATKLSFYYMQAIGFETVPIGWLLFVLQYTGRVTWLTRRRLALLSLIPVAMLAVLYTNAWHHLYFSWAGVHEGGPVASLELGYAPLYWLDVFVGVSITIAGSLLLVRHLLYRSPLYRMQMWGLIVAIAAPLIASILYESGWSPMAGLDLTPFAFVVTGAAVVWSVYRLRLLNVTPLARDLLFDSMHDGVLVLDVRGAITDLNRAARQYLGLDETVIGRPVRSLHTGWSELAADYIDGGQGPVELVLGDRVPGYLEVAASPVFDRRGRPAGRLLVFRDIAARKEAEAAVHAREVAESANRAKDQFLANVSHELRTPMHGIIGMNTILLGTALSAEQQEYTQTMLVTAEGLLGLLDSILDLAKIEAGKLELEMIDFELAALLYSVSQLLGPKAQAKGLDLMVTVGDDVPPLLHGDLIRLRQVLTHLISNAIKFTAQGKITVTVAVDEPGPMTTLRFSVRDTGIGIAADKLPFLFDVFTQADSSTARQYGGSGLGLAISKQLVELWGGRIGIDSSEGHGSTFWFTVRFDKVVEPRQIQGSTARAHEHKLSRERADRTDVSQAETRPSAPVPPAPVAASPVARRHLLLVEDTVTSQKVALVFLAKLGYTADIAQNGVEAVRAVGTGKYDLVLMDVAMPEMDGLEATRRIRQMEASRVRTPIVAMTAHAMSDDRERCLAAGMDDYVTKPFSPPTLSTVLKRWLPDDPPSDAVSRPD